MTTTDEKTDAKKPLALNRPKKLELKKTVETGQVRQSFSHGRSKTVQVEVKRKRTFKRGASGRMSEVVEEQQSQPSTEKTKLAVHEVEADLTARLTKAERDTRLRAIEHAREEAERRAEEEARAALRRAEEAAEAKRRAEEEEVNRKAAEAEQASEAAETATEQAAAAEQSTPPSAEPEAAEAAVEIPSPVAPAVKREAERADKSQADAQPDAVDDELGGRVKKKQAARPSTPARGRGEPRRRQGKLTISQALEDGESQTRQRSLAAVRRQREREKEKARERLHQGAKIVREVVIPETITVQELANRMAERGAEVVKSLMKMGVLATITQSIDADTAELVVEEFGHKAKRVSAEDIEVGLRGEVDEVGNLHQRAPVVTVMGHVDHGKTSLLDALKRTDVAAHEAGGITQHIGAYQIEVPSGDKITFIDTPGHAAFTEMRARGANVTDIVVLVVAADDGIKAQTIEAINHAKAAEVPIIVAINKMDKPDADPNRVKNDLLQQELVPEDMGGDVICVPVSAKTGDGLDDLVEAISLQAEMLELKTNADRPAEGVVIEAKLEQGRGSVATVLIQRGTLRVGDIFVAGSESGRVRALLDDRGERIESAGPAQPVEVLGLTGTPDAGDDFIVVVDDARAREVASHRSAKKKQTQIAATGRGSLEQMLSKIKEGQAATLPILVKSDVHGSLEAITGALENLGTEEVEVRVLHSGVGGINESDITLANASSALVIAFNVRANAQARNLARRDGVDIRYYSIIYDVIDDIKKAMSGLLSPEQNEKFLGYAEIREVFSITKVGKVAGCMVTEGQVKRGAKVRLLRDDVVIHDGTLKTLRRFKDEVREVQQGYECGMAFENYQDIQVGDRIECYEIEEVARSL